MYFIFIMRKDKTMIAGELLLHREMWAYYKYWIEQDKIKP